MSKLGECDAKFDITLNFIIQVFRLGTPTSVRVADQRMNETKPAYVRMV